jgi:hypothetical protein
MPRSAAAMMSSRVSPARLAGSTPLRLAHSGSTAFSSGRRRAAAPPPARTAGVAARHPSHGCGGRQPVPQQGRLLPAEKAAQLDERADQRLGVVGADLVVEGGRRAATARAVAQPSRHRGPLPFEVVADDGGVADRRPGPAGHRQQRGPRLIQNTMTARRRRALRRILGSVLGHPTVVICKEGGDTSRRNMVVGRGALTDRAWAQRCDCRRRLRRLGSPTIPNLAGSLESSRRTAPRPLPVA